MSLNVVVPFGSQLLHKNGCAITECEKDLKGEKDTKNEKEEGKEKEITADLFVAYNLNIGELTTAQKSLVSHNEQLVSELFTFIPERPPNLL